MPNGHVTLPESFFLFPHLVSPISILHAVDRSPIRTLAHSSIISVQPPVPDGFYYRPNHPRRNSVSPSQWLLGGPTQLWEWRMEVIGYDLSQGAFIDLLSLFPPPFCAPDAILAAATVSMPDAHGYRLSRRATRMRARRARKRLGCGPERSILSAKADPLPCASRSAVRYRADSGQGGIAPMKPPLIPPLSLATTGTGWVSVHATGPTLRTRPARGEVSAIV
ncbi:hypothetical protein DFH06DRAFT_1349501 [Mycena polygramma]|nr:hypothetical protein DFH06DRAFT_1349501 [Mycena polygramma]